MIDKNQKLVAGHHARHQISTSTPSDVETTTSKNAHQLSEQKIKQPPPPLNQQQAKEQTQNKSKTLDRSSEIMKNWYPLRFKLNFPNKSALNTFEQKDFIEMAKKFHNRTHISQKEVKNYKLYAVNIYSL